MKKFLLVSLSAFILAFSGCGSVVRLNPNMRIDLSGYWNDADVKIVCDALIKDCLSSTRVNQAIRSMNRTPVVVVGTFRNESNEHIDTGIISSIMEKTIFDSGKLDFVAGGAARDELRQEREQQQEYANPNTAARAGNEIGADFRLTGTVRSIVDREGNESVRTYFVTAELTDIETAQRLWIGQNNQIKKYVSRPKNRL